MTNIHTEKTFEAAIVASLVEQGGYAQGNAEEYSVELGIPRSHALRGNAVKARCATYYKEVSKKTWDVAATKSMTPKPHTF